MGLRYRKSVKCGPLRFNFSKSGVGYSFGGRGFRFTKKANGGYRTTASIPGSGISYVKDFSGKTDSKDLIPSTSHQPAAKPNGCAKGCLAGTAAFFISVFALGVVGSFLPDSPQPTEQPTQPQQIEQQTPQKEISAELPIVPESPIQKPVPEPEEKPAEESAADQKKETPPQPIVQPQSSEKSIEKNQDELPQPSQNQDEPLAQPKEEQPTSEPQPESKKPAAQPQAAISAASSTPSTPDWGDGNNIEVTADYVLNTNTMKFHQKNCRYVKKIEEKNFASCSSREEATANGYQPCKVCCP